MDVNELTKAQAAEYYRKRGWYPIPLCWPDEKGNCGCGQGHKDRQIGKAPLVNWKGIKPSLKQVREWWRKWPNANIGILLDPSGLLVVDPDSSEAEKEVEILQIGGVKCRTGRGSHRYFRRPEDIQAVRLTKKGASGEVDILAAGYSIVPPSVHRNGKSYLWEEELPEKLPEPPEWVRNFFTQRQDESGNRETSFEEVLARNRDRIPRKVLETLLAEKAEQGRRSDILWWMEHEMSKAGVPASDIFTLIKGSVWNKYRGRSDEDKRLREEIARAVENEVVDKPADPLKSLGLRIENFNELMSDLSQYPGWLIEGFWTRRSHGIIAGEPKTFKSTIALDMAVSVASGTKFLGKFKVGEQGPVLMVQNENAPWILKDRIAKIMASRGLTGDVQKKRSGKYQIKFAPTLPIYFINQQGFNLLDPIYRKALEKVVEETEPILLILDPLYLMFDGDVNSAKDLNPVLNWLLDLKWEYNLGIVVIHHMNKNGKSQRGGQRLLGSTTLHGWVESALYISIDNKEEQEAEDIMKPGSPVSLSIEREFRGAGIYPNVKLSLVMGEFGDYFYSVRFGSEEMDANSKIKSAIISVLEMSTHPVSLRKLMAQLGVGRKKLEALIDELEAANLVRKSRRGLQLASLG